MTTARTATAATSPISTNGASGATGSAHPAVTGNGHALGTAGAHSHSVAERLKMAVRAGNHLDHREIEVHDMEVRFRDRDGQTYRVDLNHPDILRRILRSDVAEPVARPSEFLRT